MDVQTFTPDDTVAAIIGKFRSDLGEHTGPFGLLVQFRVHDGAESQVRQRFGEAQGPTLRDSGCMAFEMSRHATDCRRFFVHERWISLAALDAHLRTPHASTLRDAFNQFIDGLPEFSVLIPID